MSVLPSAFAQSAPTAQFRDITGDIYASEIEQAVTLGIVAGFEDQTFRPQTPVTRELNEIMQRQRSCERCDV